jgi:hypothetical protein
MNFNKVADRYYTDHPDGNKLNSTNILNES